MNLYRYFLGSSYSLFAISLIMVVATGRCDVVTTLLFTGVLVAGWSIDTGRLVWAVGKRGSNWLMLGCLIFALVEWRGFGVEPVVAIIHLTLFASALKLLRLKTSRDWLWLYLVSFCLTLMTAGMTVNAMFLFLLILYLFAGLSTLVSYEIRQTQLNFATFHTERNPGAEFRFDIEFWKETRKMRQKTQAPAGRSLLVTSILTLVMILLLATPLFLVMPRMARAGSRNGLLSAETLTGFSDTVRLGEVAQVKQNPQVVMRVRVRYPRGEAPRPLRWRGVTLNYYDGQSWSESARDLVRIKRVAESFKVDERIWNRSNTEQRFFLEPININVIFAAPRPLFLTGLRELYRDGGDGLWTEDHSFFKLEYVVYSDIFVPTDLELADDNSRDYPREISQRYLQLPRNDDSRQITELAANVTKGATTQFEITHRIEKHLRESYSYTLDLKRVEEGDPVADFLFNVKAGHCEYFASAMVLMLRSRRIPARLVNGFQTGEYNESVDVYTVRQSDAHSWVEVYFPKQGWVTFDPTPPAGLSVYGDGLSAWFRRYGEAMEMFWLEHVVGFDTGKQLSIARAAQNWLASYQMEFVWMSNWRLGEWLSELSGNFDSWRSRKSEMPVETRPREDPHPSAVFTHPLTLALFSLSCLAAMVLLWRKNNPTWRRNRTRDAGASAIAFYQEMLKRLESIGHKRKPDQTPSEFAAQLAVPPVTEITRLYERIRFGNETLGEDDVARIGLLLRELSGEPRSTRLFAFWAR